MERDSSAMLRPLFSLLLCSPASSAALECQTKPSDDEQSVGKPYVSEVTEIGDTVIQLTGHVRKRHTLEELS